MWRGNIVRFDYGLMSAHTSLFLQGNDLTIQVFIRLCILLFIKCFKFQLTIDTWFSNLELVEFSPFMGTGLSNWELVEFSPFLGTGFSKWELVEFSSFIGTWFRNGNWWNFHRSFVYGFTN